MSTGGHSHTMRELAEQIRWSRRSARIFAGLFLVCVGTMAWTVVDENAGALAFTSTVTLALLATTLTALYRLYDLRLRRAVVQDEELGR